MSKRLILILALAFVLGLSLAAYAEVQNVKVSGDLTVLGARRQLTIGDNSTERNSSNFVASIARVRVDADLTDNVMATVRLINERYWGRNDENTNLNVSTYSITADNASNIDLDLAYATMKEFLYSPLTLTVGRQELHFGNDMIVGAATTNNIADAASPLASTVLGVHDPDLSMRKSFDAIRATLNYDPLVIDLIGAKVKENTLTKRDDSNLYGVYATYALNKKTSIQPYWFLRQKQAEDTTINQAIGKDDLTHVVGVLLKAMPIENLSASIEGAVQLGKAAITPNYSAAAGTGTTFSNKDVTRRAFAGEVGVNYAMPKVKYMPSVTALYAYFSGQKGDDNKRVTQWDPMYENQTYGHIANALFNQTNAHILGGMLTAKPMEDVSLKGEYYAFWWDKVYSNNQTIYDVRSDPVVMKDSKFAAQEVDLTATYDYTEDVQFSLMGNMLVPGNAFAKSNRKVANEVIGQMKVTF